MSVDAARLIARFRRHPEYHGQIVHVQEVPERAAVFAEVAPPLPDRLRDALRRQGVDRFYRHQAEAVDLARSGFPFVVTTPTASGKSLCYNAPVLEALLLDPKARALYLFPTKALAQDQAGKLRDLDLFPEIVHATYDGDTAREERGAIKRTARLIITNPDMLHVGILPYHAGWGTFFRNLRYVVVDEAHVYRGVFGAHVGNILRRLRRVAARYGASPQFIACSATIANPDELFQKLTGVETPPEVVGGDGAPGGRRHFVFWNPPVTDEATGTRRSTNAEATTLFTTLVAESVRTICFTRARKTTELLLTYARRAFESTVAGKALSDRVLSYRAGYTPGQRREIERRLFDGDLVGVTATNALELGVDIGGMDAVVMTGYPGTVASTWQQAGRAGRRQGDALAVLVAADNPLDQFLMRRPEYFFGRPHEHAALDPANRHILGAHLLCAAYESPIDEADVALFGGDRARRVLNRLVEEDLLCWRGDRVVYAGTDYPAGMVNIRSASANNFVIVRESGAVLGTVEEEKAFEQVHPGAIYLHMGESYLVTDMDIPGRRVTVAPSSAAYFTEPRIDSTIEIVATHGSKEFGQTVAYFGDVTVTTRVLGYKQKQLFSDEVVGAVDLDLPERVFQTEAVWYPVPHVLAARLNDEKCDLAGGVHALEHASIGLLPLFALCDRNDIGGVSTPWHGQVGAPAIFVHDAHPGGVGIAETGFRLIGEWLAATRALIDQCPCEDGCPSCIQSPKCGNNNQPLDKRAAALLLEGLLAGDPP